MWIKNVKEAFLAVFVWEGLLPFLIQIDRLGNALCGGNPRTTVSGRTGCFAGNKPNPYWKLLEKIIDFTFLPIDGPGHCRAAWIFENNFIHRESSHYALGALSLVVVFACPVIAVVTYGSTLPKRIKIWLGTIF